MTDEPAYWDGCGAAETGMAIEADGAVKGCPSLHKGEYGGGNVRDAPLAEIWAAMQDTVRPNVERPAWGFSASRPGSGRPPDRLLPAALDRGAEPDRLAIFGDRAPGDVEALGA